jgi:peptide/nickel transport system substrate-binding protein
MKTKLWCFLILILLLLPLAVFSGGKKEGAKAETGKKEMVTIKLKKLDGTAVEKQVEKPQYGGELNLALWRPHSGFDDCRIGHNVVPTFLQTNEQLLIGDWARGPAGTGEYSMLTPGWTMIEHHKPHLAESWELIDNHTFIFKIRPGIHWHNVPPVNGRELTAEDVAFNLKLRIDKERCPTGNAGVLPGGWKSVEVLDKYTVKAVTPGERLHFYIREILTMTTIRPPEMYEKYGDMANWKNACGTGPFILKEFRQDEIIVMEKNPDYWAEDPLHPGNKLPYIDRQNILYIQDRATQLAALRTGKIDRIRAIPIEQGNTILKQNPDIQYKEYLDHIVDLLSPRHDVKPFGDVRVRRAMMMAIDQQAIARDYWRGKAEFFNYHVPPYPENANIYTPYEKAPEDIKILYEHRPEMAKKLLAEAGYPDGFKTEVLTKQEDVEVLSIIKGNLAEVGIDMDIKVLESGTFESFRVARVPNKKYPQMIYAVQGTAVPRYLAQWVGPHREQYSNVMHPEMEDAIDYILNNWYDTEKRDAKVREAQEFIKRNVLALPSPSPYIYTMWSPWLKGYHGEWSVGNQARETWPQFVWIDQALKASK